MITIQYLMSEHFSDSISNRSARPEENTAEKKYLTRLLDHSNIDLLCDKESSLTDLPESRSHKELLHNIYGLTNHGSQIIPVTYKEPHVLSRPPKAMIQWRIHYMPKEVHLLSGPLELQPITDYTTQYMHKEKDLPQLPSTSEAQHTHREPATVVSQALIASCKLRLISTKMVISTRISLHKTQSVQKNQKYAEDQKYRRLTDKTQLQPIDRDRKS